MNPSRVRWGILLILIGLVFLANNVGWLSWWIWVDLLRLWPVLLIAIGLEMIFKKSKLQFLGYFSTLLIMVMFLWVIVEDNGIQHGIYTSFSSSSRTSIVELENETGARFGINFSDGRLLLNDGDNCLLKTRVRGSRDRIVIETTRLGNHCDVKIHPKRRSLGRFVDSDDNYWKLYVNPDLNSSYQFDLSNTDLKFYGTNLPIDTILIDARSSDLMFKLGDQRELVYLDINGKRADLLLYLPDSAGIKIEGNAPGSSSISRFGLIETDGFLVNDLFRRVGVNFHIKSDVDNGKLRLKHY